MKKTEPTDVRTLLSSLITRRAGSGKAREPASVVARRTYDELAAVLVPLVSEAGFDALVKRALLLAQREYADLPADGHGKETDPAAQIALWLDRQDEADTIDAAAAMFAAVAELLTTLIGEPLTTRYLRKAWPDGFTDERSEGTHP